VTAALETVNTEAPAAYYYYDDGPAAATRVLASVEHPTPSLDPCKGFGPTASEADLGSPDTTEGTIKESFCLCTSLLYPRTKREICKKEGQYCDYFHGKCIPGFDAGFEMPCPDNIEFTVELAMDGFSTCGCTSYKETSSEVVTDTCSVGDRCLRDSNGAVSCQ
jgi:hypothetical protein